MSGHFSPTDEALLAVQHAGRNAVYFREVLAGEVESSYTPEAARRFAQIQSDQAIALARGEVRNGRY